MLLLWQKPSGTSWHCLAGSDCAGRCKWFAEHFLRANHNLQEFGYSGALQLAKLILGISQATGGAGNFR